MLKEENLSSARRKEKKTTRFLTIPTRIVVNTAVHSVKTEFEIGSLLASELTYYDGGSYFLIFRCRPEEVIVQTRDEF